MKAGRGKRILLWSCGILLLAIPGYDAFARLFGLDSPQLFVRFEKGDPRRSERTA